MEADLRREDDSMEQGSTGPDPDPDVEEQVEDEAQAGKDKVEEQSEESFPASDPPSY